MTSSALSPVSQLAILIDGPRYLHRAENENIFIKFCFCQSLQTDRAIIKLIEKVSVNKQFFTPLHYDIMKMIF